MQSATLFFLASNLAVLFGWQPMPDGSPRYEYVVQLDPDLVATLEAGQSIPISTDIPEAIQPIGRIRIVVGREPLPRTRLTTALKPSEKKSRAGLLETQYRVAPVESNVAGSKVVESNTSGRYRDSQAILPPNTAPQGNYSRLAETPQRDGAQPSQILPSQDPPGLAGSVQGATRQLGNQLRNVGESVRIDAQQMFGAVGNNPSSGLAGQVGNTVDQLRQGFQQSVEPFRQATQQAGQHLHNAVENLGQQTRGVVDQFGRPLREQSILAPRQNEQQTILPPRSAPPKQQFAGSQTSPRQQPLEQPISSPPDHWQASPWKNSAPIAPGNILPNNNPPPSYSSSTTPARAANPNSGVFNPPLLPQNEYQNQRSQQNKSPQHSTQPTAWPSKTPSDGFDLANHPAASQPSSRDDRYSSPPQVAASTDRLDNSSAPEIRRSMLDKPADAEVLTASRRSALPPSNPAFTQSPASNPTAREPQASDFGWDNASQSTTDNSPPRDESPPQAAFPLVLSWVLLSGSFFGNFYLLWSFWDVRNKYRGLVHNARSSGGRYSGS